MYLFLGLSLLSVCFAPNHTVTPRLRISCTTCAGTPILSKIVAARVKSGPPQADEMLQTEHDHWQNPTDV